MRRLLRLLFGHRRSHCRRRTYCPTPIAGLATVDEISLERLFPIEELSISLAELRRMRRGGR